MQILEGHIIRQFNLDDKGYELVIVTDSHRFVFEAEGDCCANAYFISPEKEDVNSIIDQKVIKVTSSGVSSEAEDDYNFIDAEFYSIKTQIADLDLELRTEHNGYYCGWVRLLSSEAL